MQMGPDNRGIEEQVLQFGIAAQGFENSLPDASFAPAVVTLKNRVRLAEPLGQIAPWSSGLGYPKHGIDEQSIVLGGPPRVAFLTRQMGPDPFPLFVRQFVSPHRFAPP
jgi:hypothetical protein